MKKTLAIVLSMSMMLSVPAFADTTTPAQPTATVQTTTTAQTLATGDTVTLDPTTPAAPTQNAGITPDSALYALDKLMEKIQLALITDAVTEAETLAKIASERLAESNAMADAANIELSQKALEEYKANLEKAVTLVETAMEEGKQVAEIMDGIQDANLKDAAVVEKILAGIPEEFRAEVKSGLEQLAAATDAANETAQVVENKEEKDNNVKLEITLKLIEEKVQDEALLAKIKEAGLNTRQVIAILSLAEQSEKPLGEVLDTFLANDKGIGATAHELGLTSKEALKGINSSFKDAKETIKKAFKEAMKVVEDEDKEEVEAIVDGSLTGQTTTATTARTVEEVKETAKKLEKVVDEAKAQVEAISAATAEKKVEKEIEKLEKKAEKALEKIEKAAEKKTEEIIDKEDNDDKKQEVKAENNDNDDNDNDRSEREEKPEKGNKKDK